MKLTGELALAKRWSAVVVMGISGSGKSTIGMAIASALRLPFLDADDLHSPENVGKMSLGIPLGDEDRKPWLDAIAAKLADKRSSGEGIIVACSALKLDYRNRLRSAARVRFIFLDADEALATRRLSERAHHFMPQSLIKSQLHDLEQPTPAESDVLTVPASMPIEAVVTATLAYLCGAR